MRALSVLALFFAVVSAHAAPWIACRVSGAAIYVHAGEGDLARQVGEIVTTELPRIRHAIGLSASHSFPIYVYRDSSEFHRNTQSSSAVRGVTLCPPGKVSVDAGEAGVELRHVVTHEMTHALLYQRLGRHYFHDLPTWANEGMAEYLSAREPFPFLGWIDVPFVQYGSVPMKQLSGEFHNINALRCQSAYAQSRAMIAWLEHRHPGALRLSLNGVAHGRPFNREIAHASGMTMNAWYHGWYADMQQAKRRGAWAAGILVGFALLASLLGRRKRQFGVQLEPISV